MKAIDKYGNPIYPKVFRKLLAIGKVLEENNWGESIKKPNLFYKKFEDVCVFADMRSTDVIPIWEDPCPMLYSSKTDKPWKARKALRKASEQLENSCVEYRYSFYHDCENSEEEIEEIRASMDNYGIYDLPDGQCHMCSEEFDSNGLFCSENCEKAYLQLKELRDEEFNDEIKCSLCSKSLDRWSKNTINHHISYEPEKIIIVCRSCHRKIHSKHKEHPELAPCRTLREIKRDSKEKN